MGRFHGGFACAAALVMMLAMIVLVAPRASAYSNVIQWQVGFSGNFDVPSSPMGTGGFWGWCVFGGSNGSRELGTLGTTADCKVANYFRPTVGVPNNPILVSYDITTWAIGTGSAFCLSPKTPCFFFTAGTVTLQGPGAALIPPTGVPTGVPIPLKFPCPALVGLSSPPPIDLSSLAMTPCDSGIPAMPGHFSFHPIPGISIQIQVTKIG